MLSSFDLLNNLGTPKAPKKSEGVQGLLQNPDATRMDWQGGFGGMGIGNPGSYGGQMSTEAPGFEMGQVDSAIPEVAGGWMKGVGMGVQVANVGLGIFNALESRKMNKFMRGYYGDKMDMDRKDFGNAAKSTNLEIANRFAGQMDAQGKGARNSEANNALVAEHMKTWGVSETF